MSNLRKTCEYLNYIGIEISIDELFKLQIIQWNNAEKHRLTVMKLEVYNPSAVVNGKVVAAVGLAVLGFGVALALGAGLATAIAIGAAIGYRMLRGNPNSKKAQVKEQRTVNAPGFDSTPTPPQIGAVIPLVYCNTSLNFNGGIRSSGGSVIFSRIITSGNAQILAMARCIGLGKISFINPTKMLVDGQPIDNFLATEIVTQYSSGDFNQPRFAGLPFYSQASSVPSNNQVGLSKRGKVKAVDFNILVVDDEDYDNFNPSEIYYLGGYDYRLTNKATPNRIFFNKQILNAPMDAPVYCRYKSKFKTSKRCTRVEINMLASVWCRDKEGNLKQSAIAAALYINAVFITNFYIVNSKEGDLRRTITVASLPLGQHLIEIYPLESIPVGSQYIRLDDSQIITTLPIPYGGGVVALIAEFKLENNLPYATVNSLILGTDRPQKSTDRGATIKITSINQIVLPTDIGQSSITNYPSLKLVYNELTASDRLSQSPTISDFIEQGVPYRNHIAAGVASPTSASNSLITFVDLSQVSVGHIVRNITRQAESAIVNIIGTQVISSSSLNWQSGDKFLIYFTAPITYFPDVFVHSLLAPENMGYANNEKFIDYPSICKSRKFCVNNKFFFNDEITNQVRWDEWVSRESMASLLFPTDFSGTFGLLPEESSEPVAIFTASNILPGSYRESPPDTKEINAVQLTYNSREDDNIFKKTLTVLTQDAYLGIEQLKLESLEYESISSQSQAKAVLTRYLKSRIIQNKVIQFKTGLQGFGLEAGDIIAVQYTLTNSDIEFTGFCWTAQSLISGTQIIELTADKTISSGTFASIYHLQTGLVEKNKPIVRLSENNYSISGLTEAISPRSATYNGDIVIVNGTINSKLYRVTSIKPDNYGVSVYAINWSANINSESGLYFVS